MDTAAELGRSPVSKYWIQPEYGDEQADAGRDCRTCLARPNSQARTRTRKHPFPCSADHVQDWQSCPVDPCSCYMCDHTPLCFPAMYDRGVSDATCYFGNCSISPDRTCNTGTKFISKTVPLSPALYSCGGRTLCGIGVFAWRPARVATRYPWRPAMPRTTRAMQDLEEWLHLLWMPVLNLL